DRVELLSGIERGLRHRNSPGWSFPFEYRRHDAREIVDREGQEDAIPAGRIRIDPHDMLPVEVLQRVGDKSILPEDDYAVRGAEYEVRQVAALQPLKTAELAKDLFGLGRGDPIALMLREVVGEIGAQVLDIELCLLDRVEA